MKDLLKPLGALGDLIYSTKGKATALALGMTAAFQKINKDAL
jgi:hypothetical protein